MDKPDAATEELAQTLLTLNRHPPVLLPCLYRSPRSYTKSCALFGCSLPIKEEESPYCCLEHKNLSRQMSQQRSAFHYFDGFRDGNHRDTTCAACVILRNSDVDIGIPILQNENIFSTVPWAQEGIFRTDQDANRDWLFFHKPPTVYKSMANGFFWRANGRMMFVMDGKDIDKTTLSLRSNDKKEKGSNDKKEKGKENWILYLFQHGQMSLYCLSYTKQGVKEPKLSKESHNKKKTQDEDQNNPEDKKTGKKTGKKTEKKRKTSSVNLEGTKDIIGVSVPATGKEVSNPSSYSPASSVEPSACSSVIQSQHKNTEVRSPAGRNQETTRSQQSSLGEGNILAKSSFVKAASELQATAEPHPHTEVSIKTCFHTLFSDTQK